MIISDNKFLIIGLGIGAAVIAALVLKKAATVGVEVIGDAAQAINPLNQNNVINQGANSIYQAATGSKGSMGGDFYDATHGGMLDWGGIVNPTSNNNVIYRAQSWLGSAITGDENWTPGGQLYDWTH